MQQLMKRKVSFFGPVIAASAVVLALSVAANAQYTTDFEDPPFPGSMTGEPLVDDGFYTPAGIDYLVFTYAGNTPGVAPNPGGGGLQFAGGAGDFNPNFSRGQRDINWGTGIAKVTYDSTCVFTGITASNNLGSFSVQPYPGSQNYIHLFSWVDILNPVDFNAFYMPYDSAGVAFAQPGASPGPMWEAIPLNAWMRYTTVIDFPNNLIIEVSIENLDTGQTDTFAPTDWYLEGGAAGGFPLPTGFRMFSGGGTEGNVVAFDNLVIEVDISAGFAGTLDCPIGGGKATLSLSGGTPNGKCGLVASTNGGGFTIPVGPCKGTIIATRPAFLPGFPITLTFDPDGDLSVGKNVPAGMCGVISVSAVDLTTCDVVDLP